MIKEFLIICITFHLNFEIYIWQRVWLIFCCSTNNYDIHISEVVYLDRWKSYVKSYKHIYSSLIKSLFFYLTLELSKESKWYFIFHNFRENHGLRIIISEKMVLTKFIYLPYISNNYFPIFAKSNFFTNIEKLLRYILIRFFRLKKLPS